MPKLIAPVDSLFRLVNDVHLEFAKLFNHRAVEFGLTRAHWRVIAGLFRHEGLTQTELANAIGMARSPLGKIVDRLEESGLIERTPDPDDRRVNRLSLTRAAQPLIEPAQALAAQIETAALRRLPKQRQAALIDALIAIRTALEAELEQESVSGEVG